MASGRNETGSSYIELVVSVAVLAIGLLAHASLTVTGHTQTRQNEERRRALTALRSQIEILRGYDFGKCFVAFDEETLNDPPSAPGPHFDVEGLEPSPGDPDRRVGRVRFPTAAPTGSGPFDPSLREDVVDTRLGMPADLDGDGVIDSLPKDQIYVRLPVLVEARWRGVVGDQEIHLVTWLTPRR